MAVGRGVATFKCRQYRAVKQRCTLAQRIWIESQKSPKCDHYKQHRKECEPPGPPAIRMVKPSAVEVSKSSPGVGTSSPSDDRAILRCTHALNEISWDAIEYPNFNEPEKLPDKLIPKWKQAIVYGYIYGKYDAANMVLYRLWERQEYIRIYCDLVSFVKGAQDVLSAAESERIFKEKFAKSVPSVKSTQPPDPDVSNEQDIKRAVEAILRRGARWHALVVSVDSKEIFLVDQTKNFGDSVTTIGKVIEDGQDDEFEVVKHFSPEPENGLRDNCFRLTGLSSMIHELVSTSKGTDVRRYLLKEARERIEMEFGPPINIWVKPAVHEIEFFFGRPQRDITSLFGFQIQIMFDDNGAVDVDEPESELSQVAALRPLTTSSSGPSFRDMKQPYDFPGLRLT